MSGTEIFSKSKLIVASFPHGPNEKSPTDFYDTSVLLCLIYHP